MVFRFGPPGSSGAAAQGMHTPHQTIPRARAVQLHATRQSGCTTVATARHTVRLVDHWCTAIAALAVPSPAS